MVTLFLGGDVMTGRGIDQVLPHPSEPRLHEPFMRSALGYVELAQTAHGPIPRPVSFTYIWGDALAALARMAPDVRIINLETSVTTSQAWIAKGINYRMHPKNIPCLTAAQIDCCVLANNHVLDWGHAGLTETLDTLHQAGMQSAGAGRNLAEAAAPAILEVPGTGRVLVFAGGLTTSGIPHDWAANADRAGVHLIDDLSDHTVERLAASVRAVKRPGDLVVASLHWGGNWGYAIPQDHTRFAHQLIDTVGVDVVHGHSSHHAKGIEVYRDKLILYGCGDLLNDYEGIPGYERFRDDLAVMYFVRLDASSGRLVHCDMTPMQMRRFRLQSAVRDDVEWLRDTLTREGRRLGTHVIVSPEYTLTLRWHGQQG
jgi:poly-gamma-glutamate synthesis protein (capsule biosynthesis protein)